MSHVQTIKKRFEDLNLSNEISVDIVPLRLKPEGKNNQFKRSATLIEFSSSNFKNSNNNSSKNDPELIAQDIFQRHNSDNSYKSLRRSQAFRLDGQQKPNLVPKPSPSKLKRHNAVRLASPSSISPQFEEELYLETSETIKKALKQPLPQGPAPKKPPRTFASSPRTSPMSEISILDDLEKATEKNNPDSNIHDDIKVNHSPRPKSVLPPKSRDDKKGISSLLNCIISPCSIDPIYYEQLKRERHPIVGDEKIYMEPFEHLHHMEHLRNDNSNKTDELHYLCTNIIDQTNSNNSSISQNDINRSFLDSCSKESNDLESYEKINFLMDVVYDEKHRDNLIDESSGSSEIEIKSPVPKVTRSMTEKRKDYVRRVVAVSTVKVKNELFTSSHQKQVTASSIITRFQRIIDSNRDEMDNSSNRIVKNIDNCSLFKMVLLVGYDMMNQKPYIKSIYPTSEKALPMLEQFIYPNSKNASDYMTIENQNFSLILTDEYGNNLFGYCRQIIAEGFEEKCLPLTYCIISSENDSGFYFSLLKEIESRHGYPEVQFSRMMKSLQCLKVPKAGQTLNVKLSDESSKKFPEIAKKSECKNFPTRTMAKRLSLESPEWLKSETSSVDFKPSSDEITILRTNDIRQQNMELTVLHESTTNELLIMIFGTLLIERKVILLGNNISQITSCVTALYSILYPFQWHHTILTLIPDNIIELLQAPFPFFAGVLKSSIDVQQLEIFDGIVVDLEKKTLLQKCGDECTLVPESLKKSLMLSLKIMETFDKGDKIKNVLMAEAFLKFFVKLFAQFDPKIYDKGVFINSQRDQSTKYFLEWFLDTIMFKEFLLKKQADDMQREKGQPSSAYFGLYNHKILGKSDTLNDNNQHNKNVEKLLKSKHKKKNFKDKIKDFLRS